MSSACKVSLAECNNPNHKCDFVEKTEIKELTDLIFHGNKDITDVTELNQMKKEAREALHKLSSNAVDNAFYHVDFGGDFLSIYGCSPSNMMHAFLKGVPKVCIKVFIDPLKPKTKAAVDNLVDYLSGQFRTSEKINMLKTNFTHGMTTLTMITANKWAGMAFTLLLLICTDSGFEILNETGAFGEED
jgi:hypothetical protein